MSSFTPVIDIPAAPALRRRWTTLNRDRKIALAGIAALLVAAVGLRIWFMAAYPEGFLGFPDTSQYIFWAATNAFGDVQHPAGYPLFLQLLHLFSPNVWFVLAAQHALGIATGLLLYKAVRRTGAPPWLGLLPAAVVFFGGTGLFLEHAVLGDLLFAFLQALALYFAIRALYEPARRWPLLAGLAIGASFWDKTAATSTAILIPIILLCAAPGARRNRLISALLATTATLALIALYISAQYASTGYLGYERQSAWNPYEKVATFVDCTKFTPPPGTAFLCPPEPPNHRQPPGYYQYSPKSPAVKRFNEPYNAKPSANSTIATFTVAAIEHEPLQYAKAILHGLTYYLFPRSGEGSTPQTLRTELVYPENRLHTKREFRRHYYADSVIYSPPRDLSPAYAYEGDTRLEGAVLILLLIAAVIGPVFLAGRQRWAATAFALTAICSITFAIAGNCYDARYAYPTFGPLAAAAALGAWGMGSRLAALIRDPIRRRRAVTANGDAA